MTYLKFYQVEHRYNKDLWLLKVHKHQVQKLVNKLSRHFHFRKIGVINNARSCGHAYWRYIDVPTITSVGLVIHETAHIWQRGLSGSSKHNKKLHTLIKRLSRYFRKYLLTQFSTLEMPKPKQKPTALQKCEARLANTTTRIKRLATKIKTLKTRLRTAKKKQTYYKKRIRRLQVSSH